MLHGYYAPPLLNILTSSLEEEALLFSLVIEGYLQILFVFLCENLMSFCDCVCVVIYDFN